MATSTTPFPSGVSASAATRPSQRDNRTEKERKERRAKGRTSHDDWLTSQMSRMVDNLCRKMYESTLSTIYDDVELFCDEYADYVIDCRKVSNSKERSRDLRVVLGHAESEGRVVICKVHHGRRTSIELSTDESEMQAKLAEERQAEKDSRAAESRRRKPHWAVA